MKFKSAIVPSNRSKRRIQPPVEQVDADRDGPGSGAWTLIELVGVLAILSVLVLVGAGAGLAYADQLARDRERDSLQDIAEALRRSVSQTLVIPDQNGYANQIANFSGRPAASILRNARGNQRLLLIDPGVTNSGFNLPFDQNAAPLAGGGAGTLNNLRMLLVSSLGAPLPGTLPAAPGGRPEAAVFANLWATPEGRVPAGLNWRGDPHDLCLQRIQFFDLFQPVALNHAEVTGLYTNGQVRLPGLNGFARPPGAPRPCVRWFLQGTPLVLSNEVDASLLSEIVQEPLTFTYEKGRWVRGTDAMTTGTGVRSELTGADFEEAVRQFLASAVPPEPEDDGNNGGGNDGKDKKDKKDKGSTVGGVGSYASAEAVVNAMSNYIRLGAIGPSQKANMEDPLDDLHDALLDYTQLPPGQLNKP
ncbi:MAG: hypothetical protein H7A46_08775 [Verrucomicrobiales bacterium]|nr:hypothetical protein [Verrucomicrobiales bacterium]